MILRGTLLMFGQGSHRSCRSNQTHNGRPWTSDDLHVIEPVVRWIATPGMRSCSLFNCYRNPTLQIILTWQESYYKANHETSN